MPANVEKEETTAKSEKNEGKKRDNGKKGNCTGDGVEEDEDENNAKEKRVGEMAKEE